MARCKTLLTGGDIYSESVDGCIWVPVLDFRALYIILQKYAPKMTEQLSENARVLPEHLGDL